MNSPSPFSRHFALRALGVCIGVMAASVACADIKVSGSDTLQAYMENALSQFNRANGRNVSVASSFKGTSVGLRDLCEGKAGIVPASAPMDEDQARRCAAAKVAYLELPIAFDAIAVIAHPAKAALGELSMAELKSIFHPESAGKVVRWSQVRAGSPDLPMTVVSLDVKSGTNAFFGSKVHGMRGFVRPDAKAVVDNSEVLRLVAADANSVGFVSMAALAESKAAVWRVPLNFGNGPVVPSQAAVLNRSYAPLSRLLYLYVNKAALSEKDSQTQQFLAWLMERGGKLASYEGFVPLIEQNYQDNLRKVTAKP
jgi:phosphate transport system substrate-binding protein